MILFIALFLLQAAPPGIVTGVVRDATGTPQFGVRVYAMQVRDSADATGAMTTLESLVQTDRSGRYRMEVPPGRYYIGTGAIQSPTFYPGTQSLEVARPFQIGSDSLFEDIDFGSFVAAPPPRTASGILASLLRPGLPAMPPDSKGVLSGIVRQPDGRPAILTTVVAVPVSLLAGAASPASTFSIPVPPGSPTLRPENIANRAALQSAVTLVRSGLFVGGGPARTDATGRYTIENVPPDTYYIVTGFSDSPTLYPGVTDLAQATAITTAAATRLDELHFGAADSGTHGVSVSGQLSAVGGAPAARAVVQIVPIPTSAGMALPKTILPERPTRVAITASDGSFLVSDVAPGKYQVVSFTENVRSTATEITVADRPIADVRLTVPMAAVSGRISMEDGSAIERPSDFGPAVVTAVDQPNIKQSVMDLTGAGTFLRALDAGEYQLYFRSLPDEYTIRSMTANGVDLFQGRLRVAPSELVLVDVRVTKRVPGTRSSGSVIVKGTLRDQSEVREDIQQVTLTPWGREAGSAERFITPLLPDGSFEFTAVPPGRYVPGVQLAPGLPNRYTVSPNLDVGTVNVVQAALLATSGFSRLTARITIDGGGSLPADANVRIRYGVPSASGGDVDAVVGPPGNSEMIATVRTDIQYNVFVAPPSGFRLKSIDGRGVRTPGDFGVQGLIDPKTHPHPIEIVLEK
jgi:hypothetical protein